MRKLEALKMFIWLMVGSVAGSLGLISIFDWSPIIPDGWDFAMCLIGYGVCAVTFALIKNRRS